MIGIELVTDRETKNPAPDEAKQVQEECRKAGLLIGCGGFYGNVLRFQPPLVITLAQADHARRYSRQRLFSRGRVCCSARHIVKSEQVQPTGEKWCHLAAPLAVPMPIARPCGFAPALAQTILCATVCLHKFRETI